MSANTGVFQMKAALLAVSLALFWLISAPGQASPSETGDQTTLPSRYAGRFCSGQGDPEFLRLIDESFGFFQPNPVTPNVSMIYKPEWDTFVEGAGWRGWWIQNSYGFSYAATPFLPEPWFSILQRSWDLFWDNQGDGQRKGGWGQPDYPGKDLIAPDGCLGDCAAPGIIMYKQGDGDFNKHDWFHEATAAGIVMQAEILLAHRDRQALACYLPRMERACDSIERTRDSANQLFLVGPACNLLAPSYGGVRQPDGSFGKGYLAGLSINYLAALDRMVELQKLAGNSSQLALYQQRQKITRASLAQLLVDGAYFVKFIEPGGTKHGVLGQQQYGYLEGVANADAVAFRVVDERVGSSIYRVIAGFPDIRPFDFLLTSAPGLDDTYWAWGRSSGQGLDGILQFGDWVNGGAWATVEGRAILMYLRLGKFEDVRRSATRAMKWAKDFRMDAPWSQRGENSDNSWYDEGKWLHGDGIKVAADNFAIPAATLRGLFDYEYRFDRLVLRPRVPGSVTQYTQHLPVRFGNKSIFLSCDNGGPSIRSASVNGSPLKLESRDAVVLPYDELPDQAHLHIVTEGGWPFACSTVSYPSVPALAPAERPLRVVAEQLPESLKRPFAVLSRMQEELASQPGAEYERSHVLAALQACDATVLRASLDPGPGYYRPIKPERKAAIIKFYEQAALGLYQGFSKRMADAARGGDQEKGWAASFAEARRAAGDTAQ